MPIISTLNSVSVSQNNVLLDFLRDVHHFGGLAGGAQRILCGGYGERESGSPAPTKEKV